MSALLEVVLVLQRVVLEELLGSGGRAGTETVADKEAASEEDQAEEGEPSEPEQTELRGWGAGRGCP